MEQYIVIAKRIEEGKDKFEDYRVQTIVPLPVTSPPTEGATSAEPQIPAGFEKVFGPASLNDCVNYVMENSENNDTKSGFRTLTYLQYALIGIVTLSFVVVIIIGASKLYGFRTENDTALAVVKNADDAARILITFLVAVSTVAIAFLAILTAMVIRDFKERFALAKEVLTILVGILGTIIGFYFGTANNPASNGNGQNNGNGGVPGPSQTPANSNTNTNSNTNADTNVNRTTGRTIIFRAPLEKGKYVSFVYEDSNRKTT